jgi:hypothetical protein
LLSTRVIAYHEGVANRSLFIATRAETIIKTLFLYNLGANATVANGRFIEGTIPGLTCEADAGRGLVCYCDATQENLLDMVKGFTSISGADFLMSYTGSGGWEFRWYPGQLGTDRSAAVVFSLDAGDMNNPLYTYDRINGKYAVFLAGDGTGISQYFSTSLASDYSLGVNDSEACFNYPAKTDVDGMKWYGAGILNRLRSKPVYSFQPLLVPSLVYLKDYSLGDLVAGIYLGVKSTYKVQRVRISSQRNQQPQLEMSLST